VGARGVHDEGGLRGRGAKRCGAALHLVVGCAVVVVGGGGGDVGIGGTEQLQQTRKQLNVSISRRWRSKNSRTFLAYDSRHASVAHSRHRVFPVPVGLSNKPFSSFYGGSNGSDASEVNQGHAKCRAAKQRLSTHAGARPPHPHNPAELSRVHAAVPKPPTHHLRAPQTTSPAVAPRSLCAYSRSAMVEAHQQAAM